MAQTTQLSAAPYYDDFSPQKDHYRILFQPGVSVQVRELNLLQDLFQQQIERFGDHVFQSGTIVSGCNFQYYNPYPYIKIKDIDFEGDLVIPARYLGYNVKNETTGLRGIVVNSQDGFESTSPDLKTLYVAYRNSGDNANTHAFSGGDTLRVYDPVINGIEKIKITQGGVSFSNTNKLVAVSQVVVSVTSGTLANGDYFLNSLGANLEIIGIDSVTLAAANQHIVALKPKSSDLANTQANSLNWTLSTGESVTNPSNNMTASIIRTIGAGLSGGIVTDGVGTIIRANIISKGQGYSSLPFISARSFNNSTGYATLDLTPQNYITKLIVSSEANSVGNGYAFAVTSGVIYQKGYFLRVNPQQTLISKYNTSPDRVAVGFITSEEIIDSNVDSSLLDNVNNTQNAQAPGAHRLRLIPTLQVTTSAAALTNSEFFTISEWMEGRPVKQNQKTDYSVIGDEMASRTKDSSGSFVTDPFLVTTRSALDSNNEGEFFNIVVDPGNAYIDGYHVSTTANYNIENRKGTDTAILNNHSVSLNYGNYVLLKNVAGTFKFNSGDSVNLYDTAKGIIGIPSAIEAGTLTPGGTIIGTANIRMFLHDSGMPGTSLAIYRLYLFNIQMAQGQSIKSVRSVYYNGTLKGVGDIVTVLDPTTNTQICSLIDPLSKTLLFYSGVDSLKNANACIYTYRSINTSQTISNGGASNATLVVDISSGDETFPYSGTLSNTNLVDFYIIPNQVNLVANNAVTGTGTANATSPNFVGVTTTFLSDFIAGDWVTVGANSTGGADLRQIMTISNNTFLTLSSNNSYSNTLAKLYHTFPLNIPVPFGYRSGLTGNVNINQNIITFDFGTPFTYSGTKTSTAAFNILRSGVSQLNKTPNRNKFVRICCSNNIGNTVGPWVIGVPDVFRLDGVYVGNSTVSNTGTNYIRNFFIDHNQNTDYLDLSYLYLNPKSKLTLTGSDYLLVQFDYFTSANVGFFDAVSYRQTSNAQTIFLQDSQPLSNLANVVNSFEIPEIFSDSGQEIDLLQYFDFRPNAANTVNPAATPGSAPLNPNTALTLSLNAENKFPLPDSTFLNLVEYYQGRTDSVFVDRKGRFSVTEGHSSVNLNRRAAPITPSNNIRLADISIPPYPNLPSNYSVNIDKILNNGIINQKFLTTRVKKRTISTPTATQLLPFNQPKVYTMSDIGNLDRRLKDVEYYVTLNSLETGTSGKVIPSSVDPTLDRFKFGIFVDDFKSSQFSEISNPQYAALKEDTDIVPLKMKWDLSLFGYGSGDWIDPPLLPVIDPPIPDDLDQPVPPIVPPIIIQPVATVRDPYGLGPICALNLANTVAYQMKFRNATDSLLNSSTLATIDLVNLTLASHTTVQQSIQSSNGSISQFIQNQQFRLFDSLDGITFMNADHIVPGTWLAGLVPHPELSPANFSVNDLINFLGLTPGSSGSPTVIGFDSLNNYERSHLTDAIDILGGSDYIDLHGPQQLTVVRNDNNEVIQFNGFTDSTGYLRTALQQLISRQITIQQFAGMLQVNQQVPAGGIITGDTYLPPVVLYFYNYDQGVKIEIFQGTTLIASTDTSSSFPITTPSSLSTEEIALLTGPSASNWFNDFPGFFLNTFNDTGGGFVTNAGKLSFNYNAAAGVNFTIKTTKSNNSTRWRWVMAYPINGDSVGCVPPVATPSVTPTYSELSLEAIIGCANYYNFIGRVNILTGFTSTYSINQGTPSTVIAPFDISLDWSGSGIEESHYFPGVNEF